MLINSSLLLSFNLGLLVLQVLLFATSLFLILLILVQRGKGGGLTGALGGMGGQSAFGSRAGDAFTKITIVTAVIWITLCMLTIARYNPPPAPKSSAQSIEDRSGSAVSLGVDGFSATDLEAETPELPQLNLLDQGLSDDSVDSGGGADDDQGTTGDGDNSDSNQDNGGSGLENGI
jgi:preprotein translocase subunit SecG